MTEIRMLLNMSATLYLAAKDLSEKREALATYLQFLQMLAADESFALASIEAVGAVTEDLRKAAYPDGPPAHYDLRPALELEEALLAVNNRESPALFQTPRASGKPTTRETTYWWALASALITTLMQRFQKSEQEAAQITAEAMRKRKIPLPGKPTTKTPTWKLLQAWRDKCMARQKGRLAFYWYELLVEIGNGTSATADELINANTTWVRPLGAKPRARARIR